MSALAPTSTTDAAKELVSLCRAGRLYEIERWIAAGKPLDVPVVKNRKSKTLLQIAVDTGFHSLVELIAKRETNQSSKNAALADSVSLRRLDFVELLVGNGADITSVPLANGRPLTRCAGNIEELTLGLATRIAGSMLSCQ